MKYVIDHDCHIHSKLSSCSNHPEETTERDKLRRIYIDSVKASLVGQLENTYLVDPDGSKHKLQHK